MDYTHACGMYLLVHTHICKAVYGRQRLKMCFLQLLSTLFIETRSLIEFWAPWIRQWCPLNPGICLILVSQFWDYRHVLHVCLDFTCMTYLLWLYSDSPAITLPSEPSPRPQFQHFSQVSWRKEQQLCPWILKAGGRLMQQTLIIPELIPIPHLLLSALTFLYLGLLLGPAVLFLAAVLVQSAWRLFHAHTSQHRPGHSDQAAAWWLTEGWACPSSIVNPMTWATESFLPIDMADRVLKYGHILRVRD